MNYSIFSIINDILSANGYEIERTGTTALSLGEPFNQIEYYSPDLAVAMVVGQVLFGEYMAICKAVSGANKDFINDLLSGNIVLIK